MTNLYGNNGIQNTAGDVPAPPGGTPNGAQMQGNPQSSQFEPFGAFVPAPQAGGVGQTVNTPLSHDLISRGNIPLHTHPTNAAGPPGVDSLLAQLARGQLSLNQSNYGQGTLIPANQAYAQVVAAAQVVSLPIGIASTLAVASPPIYTGT